MTKKHLSSSFLFQKIQKSLIVSPLYFVVSYNNRHSLLYKIHWHSFKKNLSTGSTKGICFKYILFLTNPFFIILCAFFYARKWGKTVYERYQLSYFTLVYESIYLSLCCNVMPIDYYRNQLYLQEYKSHINDLIFNGEAQILFPSLNSSLNLDIVDDKVKFYHVCTQNGICIPTRYGVINQETSIMTLPQADFIAKPSRGCRSAGIEVWFYKGNQNYCNEQGVELAMKALTAYLWKKSNSGQDQLILQQRIRNHNSLRRFSQEALITVRVVTVRSHTHEIIHLMSVLVLPVGEKIIGYNVVISPINEKTGELGIATNYGILGNEFTHHPDTKEQIVGFRVPFWHEIMELTKTAHHYFPDYMSLGWDIAITDQGPIVIEANQNWDVETMQKPHHMPLGKTIFPEICNKIIG